MAAAAAAPSHLENSAAGTTALSRATQTCALQASAAAARLLELESPFLHGSDVSALQQMLNANGAHLTVDGVFGPLTQAAVKAFQTAHGLTVDGIVGPATRGALGGGATGSGTPTAAPMATSPPACTPAAPAVPPASPSASAGGTGSAAGGALGANWYASAPYYFTGGSTPPDLGQVMSATGQKAFEMAFILADGGTTCTPSWNGTDPVSSDTAVGAVINTVRSGGGDVSVSAGGFGGTKLGEVCGTAAATAAAYQQVIGAYGLHAMDFDLEYPEIQNTQAIANELGAAQILQQKNPGLFVSVTMPTTTTGGDFFSQALLTEAKTLGFTPDDFSVMPFDGGFAGGAAQVTALQDFNAQLVSTFGWSSAQAYTHEGVSGLDGIGDVTATHPTAETFSQTDFQTVLSFAQSVGMGRYTFWNVNRDRQCNPVNNNGVTSGICSGVAQAPWDFTNFTVTFAKSAPVTQPSPSGSSATPAGTPSPSATATMTVAGSPPGGTPAVAPTASLMPTPAPSSTSTNGGNGAAQASGNGSTATVCVNGRCTTVNGGSNTQLMQLLQLLQMLVANGGGA